MNIINYVQVFAEDLGSKFNAQTREAWRLVLLFILTELKRGFTQCLRDKGQLRAVTEEHQAVAVAAGVSPAVVVDSEIVTDEMTTNCADVPTTTTTGNDATVSGPETTKAPTTTVPVPAAAAVAVAPGGPIGAELDARLASLLSSYKSG